VTPGNRAKFHDAGIAAGDRSLQEWLSLDLQLSRFASHPQAESVPRRRCKLARGGAGRDRGCVYKVDFGSGIELDPRVSVSRAGPAEADDPTVPAAVSASKLYAASQLEVGRGSAPEQTLV
jgi:hypothetical protein